MLHKHWFKRAQSGFYWLPATWEGWTVTGFFFAVILLIASALETSDGIVTILGSLAVPALLFIAVAYMTGE